MTGQCKSVPEEASCSHTVTHPGRLVRTRKAVGYSAFYLGKGVKSGICSSQQREAKSFQILLSLSRAEKHSFLRIDVLKPSAAATMPVVGYLPVTWANGAACPSKSVWPHCRFRWGPSHHGSGFLQGSLAALAFPWFEMARQEFWVF